MGRLDDWTDIIWKIVKIIFCLTFSVFMIIFIIGAILYGDVKEKSSYNKAIVRMNGKLIMFDISDYSIDNDRIIIQTSDNEVRLYIKEDDCILLNSNNDNYVKEIINED